MNYTDVLLVVAIWSILSVVVGVIWGHFTKAGRGKR